MKKNILILLMLTFCSTSFATEIPSCFTDHSPTVQDGLYTISIPFSGRSAKDLGDFINGFSYLRHNAFNVIKMISFQDSFYILVQVIPLKDWTPDTEYPTYQAVENKTITEFTRVVGNQNDIMVVCTPHWTPRGN
jgi:hypothetical protein